MSAILDFYGYQTYMISLDNQNNMHSRLEIIRNSENIYDISM